MSKLVLVDKSPEKKNEPVGLYREAKDMLNKVMKRTGEKNASKVASMMIKYAYENIEWITEEAAK